MVDEMCDPIFSFEFAAVEPITCAYPYRSDKMEKFLRQT